MTHATIWMSLENTMLSERCQWERTKLYDSTYVKCSEQANLQRQKINGYFVHPGHGSFVFQLFSQPHKPIHYAQQFQSNIFFQCHQPWSGLYNNLHVKKHANTNSPVKMMWYYSGWRSACGEELGFNLIYLITVSIKTLEPIITRTMISTLSVPFYVQHLLLRNLDS